MYLSYLLIIAAASLACAKQLPSSVLPLRRRTTSQANHSSSAIPVTAANYGTRFDVEVQFGNQTFLLLLDTGSSDTWVLQTGWQCINATDNSVLPQATCAYGNKTYDITSTFEQIPNEWLGVQYGIGVATGVMGYEDVTLGGITVRHQEVGIANRVTAPGDGIDNGLLGLGYPILTSAHLDTDTSNTSLLFDRITYRSLFTSMWQQGLVDPYYSMAIDRASAGSVSGPGGYLALGSLPPVAHSPNFATAPVEVTEALPLNLTSDSTINGTRQITEWTLTVGAITYGTATNSTPFQAVVDSGQPLNIIPPEMAAQVNAAFSPPAVFDPESGVYGVACNATPPAFGVQIGNQTFFHNPVDMILPVTDGVCMSSVLPTTCVQGICFSFLGDAFLRNVVAVFDFGKNEMRFAAREEHGARNSSSPTSAGLTPSASSSLKPSTGAGVKNGVLVTHVVALVLGVACYVL
ncbi:hypothetical protein LTR66_000988 [Elasticomyces elasticus]|nr:hypothetical protein LTR66_000988 [Elasticomyces elasticus]